MSHVLMVVANDDAMLEMVHLVLRCSGFTVFVVRGTEDAAAVAAHQRIDLVVADSRMRTDTGRDITYKLKSIPCLARVPFMLVNGIGVDRSGRVTDGSGRGPIPLRQFVDEVHAFFSRRRRPAPARAVHARTEPVRRRAAAS